MIFFSSKAISWGESPSVLIQGNSDSTELKYPAVTICPKVSTKYAIAERLGNYIDPMNLPKELLALRHDFFMCATGLTKKMPSYKTYKQWYNYFWCSFLSFLTISKCLILCERMLHMITIFCLQLFSNVL